MRLLPLLALGGCWPYLPGDIEDYVDTGEPAFPAGSTSLTGEVSIIRFLGDYWIDGTPPPKRRAWLTKFDRDTAFDPVETWVLLAGPDCERNHDFSQPRGGPNLGPHVTLDTPGGLVRLNHVDGRYRAALTAEHAVADTPIQLSKPHYVARLAVPPPAFELLSPDLDLDEPPTLASDELYFRWEDEAYTDWVVVHLDGVRHEDQTVVETVTCRTRGRELLVDDLWRSDTVDYWQVTIGFLNEESNYEYGDFHRVASVNAVSGVILAE